MCHYGGIQLTEHSSYLVRHRWMPWIEMLRFSSRRSPVVRTRGCTATSQPLATDAGLSKVLYPEKGGNAADAAVAMAAVLSLTEPFSTGLGGECNCMFYDVMTKKVYGLNGSVELAQSGKRGFYEGRSARAIVDGIQQKGGVMHLDDLKEHTITQVTPSFTDYKGLMAWELPPNGKGFTALMVLNILENFNIKDRLISILRRNSQGIHGNPCGAGGDTVYFTAVDTEGNASSFTNSNDSDFGTGLVPEGCGFALQNRGANLPLSSEHPNCLASGKRPYHTIIRALATSAATGQLLCSFGVMGGFMQPQGLVQSLIHYLWHPADSVGTRQVEKYLSESDIYMGDNDRTWKLLLEEGISQPAMQDLITRGHNVHWPVSGHDRSLFGRGQIITKGTWWNSQRALIAQDNQAVLWAGSDPRADGCAIGL
ncbi:glutathione hydrolase-like YwrD proenzyme [Scyliorhinus canicula]|uniref:glutathione hydrolase-like YwrD proenzyme n=1 Tax=Scyliorhinus canicula TaxID=7830 RepID=UPI0018F6E92E|nr:glutathione hydrolase-like YwrD proenzyme [Scyliorhinus canicula]